MEALSCQTTNNQFGRLKKSDLSVPRKKLVELFQRRLFGRIEGLLVRDCEPQLDPPPRIVREIKFTAETGPHPEAEATDFVLKAELVELFAWFDQIRNAQISVLTFRHGLPFSMQLEDAA